MPTVAHCQCGQEMQILDEDFGVPVECPGCGRSVVVHQGSAAAIPAPPPGPPPTSPPATVDYTAGVRPHRGAMVLVFGILGLVAPCVGIVFAILAWVMANNDLRQMTDGTMDRSGEGLTRAAKVLGIIGVALYALAMFGFCFTVPLSAFGLSIVR